MSKIILQGNSKLLQPIITQILATHQLIESKDIGAIYGVPAEFYQQEALTFVPQITLHFAEDKNDVEQGYFPVQGQINFRIANETHKTITESKLTTFANNIKTHFGANNGFVWKKGKVKCNYTDKERAYFLQILCRNINEGRLLITQVLSIQGHTPSWHYLNVRENQNESQAYPTIPPNEVILGRSRRLPRKRPIADVRFQHAVCHIYGLAYPVILYDITRKRKALVT